jgi:hypothetical protein
MVAVYGQQPFFVVEAPSAYVPPHPGPKQTGRVCTSLWQLQTLVLVTKPGWRQCTGWRPLEQAAAPVGIDGNKSLYLVFVGVVFFSQHLRLLLEQLGQQHLGCFLGQQNSSILTAFRTAVSI